MERQVRLLGVVVLVGLVAYLTIVLVATRAVVVVVVLDSCLQATTGITKSSHKSLPLGFRKTTEQTQ